MVSNKDLIMKKTMLLDVKLKDLVGYDKLDKNKE